MLSAYISDSEADLRAASEQAVELALRAGGSQASAGASSSGGLQLGLRDGRLETAVRSGHRSLNLTVFKDGRAGSASTTTFDAEAIKRLVQEAVSIMQWAQPDADNGLADAIDLAHDVPHPLRYEPASDDAAAMAEEASGMERALHAVEMPAGTELRTSEVGLNCSEALSVMVTSSGFCRANLASTQARWCSALAARDGAMARDYAQSMTRRRSDLRPAAWLAERALRGAAGQLGARTVPSGTGPVLFSPRTAQALIEDLVGALMGAAQYRRASFLAGALGDLVAADHIDLIEDPFEPWGLASGAYDAEGVAGRRRLVLDAGVVGGYFLNSLNARRLGMRTTGNASGPYNLTLSSRRPGGDGLAMQRQLGTGLLVTAITGGRTDPATGHWSRAVEGYWIEDGVPAFPVAGITLSGDMRTMLRGITHVGDDVERFGAFRTGSILIDAMHIGGRA
ncbi:Protein pmbA [Nitrospirillum viridazoti Y2]|uniref:PmbA protein n=1 Tax=Nitrospirillum amazonense TaxID=28077 RepID=A0A560INL3_9PROT|nr:metallopeptidase TldD-related protein [Nitrospirillum amazonense]EGX99438.1 Protein pmbA [Nitrospirillum amazonense Y2]TWB60616.1 PmbA protein [Nitrospirillum amazonense]